MTLTNSSGITKYLVRPVETSFEMFDRLVPSITAVLENLNPPIVIDDKNEVLVVLRDLNHRFESRILGKLELQHALSIEAHTDHTELRLSLNNDEARRWLFWGWEDSFKKGLGIWYLIDLSKLHSTSAGIEYLKSLVEHKDSKNPHLKFKLLTPAELNELGVVVAKYPS